VISVACFPLSQVKVPPQAVVISSAGERTASGLAEGGGGRPGLSPDGVACRADKHGCQADPNRNPHICSDLPGHVEVPSAGPAEGATADEVADDSTVRRATCRAAPSDPSAWT
jgi:hypothetical protein